MESAHVYEVRELPCGIRVEEITGCDARKGKVWKALARQVFCENGVNGYKTIGHTSAGAPLIEGEGPYRISVTDTEGLLAVASLPLQADEEKLQGFLPQLALGIDAEVRNRDKVVKVREKFLSDDELAMIPKEDTEANVLAWTIKEAAYKAALKEGLDFRKSIAIKKLPDPDTGEPGTVEVDSGSGFTWDIFSYILDDTFIVTLVYNPDWDRPSGEANV